MVASPEELLELLRDATIEAEQRWLVPHPIDAVEVSEPTELAAQKDKHAPLMPGAVTVVVARRGAPVLAELRNALERGPEAAEIVLARITEALRVRSRVPLANAVDQLKRAPVFAHVRYGGRNLVSNVFLPDDLDAAMVRLPYNGGRLASSGFTLVEHHREDGCTTPAFDAVAIVYAPPMSDIEKAAMEQLPESQRDLSIGCAFMCYAISAVAVVAVVILATNFCKTTAISRDEAHPPWTAVSPTATARRLLAERRRMLENG